LYRPVTGVAGDLLAVGFLGVFTNWETIIANGINLACYAAIGVKIHVSIGMLCGNYNYIMYQPLS
jgi:hypothetical protein